MQRLPNFHPSDTIKFPNGNGKVQLNASNEGAKVLMYNETPLNIDLDFLNGKSDVLHAWEANFWTLDGDTEEIDWAIDVDSLNVVNPPINAVFLTLYDPTEKLNDKAYPMPLIRQIGGQQAIVTGAATVQNDGNTLLQVVEATLQGHGTSDVIINNDGSFTLKGTGSIGTVKTNTIRDNTSGADLIDLAATAIGINQALNPNLASSVSINGQTSGTATLYMPLQGSALKLAILVLANYKNTGNQTLALPTPFSANGTWYFLTGLNGHIALLSSGVGQTMRTITTLAAGGGTTTAQGFAGDNSFGFLNVAWDTIQLQLNSAAATGPCIFVGL